MADPQAAHPSSVINLQDAAITDDRSNSSVAARSCMADFGRFRCAPSLLAAPTAPSSAGARVTCRLRVAGFFIRRRVRQGLRNGMTGRSFGLLLRRSRHLFPEFGQLVLNRALEQRCDIRPDATLRDVDRVGVLGCLVLDLEAQQKLGASKRQISDAGLQLTAEPPNMLRNWIFSGL
jgi:hypothetical protein